jgi:hypothetical protein
METAAQAAIVWVGTPGIPSPFHILHCLANSMHGPEILHCFCQTHARRPPAVTIIDHDTLMSPPPLPSLLRYVDHDLMQIATLHNSPSEDNATCPVCSKHWNSGSTFLPLHPCGHWMHYRCLI